jgi:hypothetical protein
MERDDRDGGLRISPGKPEGTAFSMTGMGVCNFRLTMVFLYHPDLFVILSFFVVLSFFVIYAKRNARPNDWDEGAGQ